MKCPNCGKELRDGARFCAECGASIPPAPASPERDRLERDSTTTPLPEAAPVDPGENLRRAKQAYKEARRAAGKSGVPKVVGAIVVALAFAGAGAAGTWAVLDGPSAPADGRVSELEEQVANLQEQLDEAHAQLDESQAGQPGDADASTGSSPEGSSEDDLGTASVPKGASEALVGTWTGEMTSTEPRWTYNKRCYGAKGHPISITITSLDSTGQLKLNVTLLYHGHEASQTNDAETTEGDRVETFENVTSTYSVEDGYSFRLDFGEDSYAEVTVTPGTKTVDTSRYTVLVESHFDGSQIATDTYTVTKS